MVNLKREVTVGEGLSIMIGIFTGVMIAWMNIQVRLSLVETNVQTNRTQIEAIKSDAYRHNNKIDDKMDKIFEAVNEIKVQLQNKADRK